LVCPGQVGTRNQAARLSGRLSRDCPVDARLLFNQCQAESTHAAREILPRLTIRWRQQRPPAHHLPSLAHPQLDLLQTRANDCLVRLAHKPLQAQNRPLPKPLEAADRRTNRAPTQRSSAPAGPNLAKVRPGNEPDRAARAKETSTHHRHCQRSSYTARTSALAAHHRSAQGRTSFRLESANHETTERTTGSPNPSSSSASGSPSQPRCQTICPRHVAGTQKITRHTGQRNCTDPAQLTALTPAGPAQGPPEIQLAHEPTALLRHRTSPRQVARLAPVPRALGLALGSPLRSH
jgi:hypothetical protein